MSDLFILPSLFCHSSAQHGQVLHEEKVVNKDCDRRCHRKRTNTAPRTADRDPNISTYGHHCGQWIVPVWDNAVQHAANCFSFSCHLLILTIALLPSATRCLSSGELSSSSKVGPLCLAEVGDVGVCMFLRTCLENQGKPSGTCAKSFFLASCCVLPNSTTTTGINVHKSASIKNGPSPFEQILQEISVYRAQDLKQLHNRISLMPTRHSPYHTKYWTTAAANIITSSTTSTTTRRRHHQPVTFTPSTTSPSYYKKKYPFAYTSSPRSSTTFKPSKPAKWDGFWKTVSPQRTYYTSRKTTASRTTDTSSTSRHFFSEYTTMPSNTNMSITGIPDLYTDQEGFRFNVDLQLNLQTIEKLKNTIPNAQAELLEVISSHNYAIPADKIREQASEKKKPVTLRAYATVTTSATSVTSLSTVAPSTPTTPTTVSTTTTTPTTTTTTTMETITAPTTATPSTTTTTTTPMTSTMQTTTSAPSTTTTTTTSTTRTPINELVWNSVTTTPEKIDVTDATSSSIVDVLSSGNHNGQITIQLSEICGITPLLWKRIVGGAEAKFGQFPWEVSLRRIVGFVSSHRCGAVLVHPSWVITAGHCASDIPTEKMVVRIGEYDLSGTNTVFPHVDFRVAERIIHEKFNFLTFENDIALLRLPEPVTLAPHIIPICLAPFKNYTGSMGTIAGWGRTSQGGSLPPKLHQVSVPFIAKKECEKWFDSGDRHQEIEPCFICAGYKNGGRDACQGDSGGPVVQQVDGRWGLVGTVSWGIGCAEPNLPGVSTLVPLYSDWIQKKTKGDVYMPDFYVNKYGKPPPISALAAKSSQWKDMN